ncbi:hypothetical protein BDZ94DRAFT_1276644 [Collybia nuda]|uniref:PWWP domain-containing protein n=1 Tax=Collybia nuda TaxID=64659 RepID=A0A9P5XSA5_9AGAR|nr:hypothetical protein BDZ94DRAFT_1276644 [Collybia nuda]
MSKKAAKAAPKTVSSYETRDVVLGKVRGFPPWPGMVVDPDSVPEQVAKERPGSKKATFYCVQFFPTGDYAWLVAKDMSKLQTHEIQSYISEPFKKSGDLLQGYRIALDPTQWEEERAMATHEAFEEEANAEVDQLESDTEGLKKAAKIATKKRKRESDAASLPPSTKAKKAPKTKKESAEPKPKKQPTKGRKNGTNKSKAMVESEDEGEDEAEAEAEGEDDGDAGPSKKTSPPPPKKAKRDKEEDGDDSKLADDPEAIKVREWRHRLQKAFLGKGIPKEEDTPSLDTLFTTVETYDKISVQYLQFSKIGKVMRHIAVLTDDKVPRDAEYHFRERAKSLVDRWHQVLNANKPNGSDAGGAGANGTTSANGNGAKVEEGKEKEKDVTEGTANIDLNGHGTAEQTDAPMAPADADAEAEAEAEVEAEAEAEGDTSILADVTMSEAGP